MIGSFSMSMPTAPPPTLSPTSSPALLAAPECQSTYIFCGDGVSSCFREEGWAINLTAVDADSGNSLTCTVRIGSGDSCDNDDGGDTVDLGSFHIDSHQMAVSPLPVGLVAKDYRIVSSSHEGAGGRLLASASANQLDIPLGVDAFSNDFISIFLTVCECENELQEGCSDAGSDDVSIPWFPRTTAKPTEDDSDAPSPSPIESVLVDPAQVLTVPESTEDDGSSSSSIKSSNKPKTEIVAVAATVFMLAVLTLGFLYCSRLRRNRAVAYEDASSDSSVSVSKDANISPWADVEL